MLGNTSVFFAIKQSLKETTTPSCAIIWNWSMIDICFIFFYRNSLEYHSLDESTFHVSWTIHIMNRLLNTYARFCKKILKKKKRKKNLENTECDDISVWPFFFYVSYDKYKHTQQNCNLYKLHRFSLSPFPSKVSNWKLILCRLCVLYTC